jgi:hypothetical protein
LFFPSFTGGVFCFSGILLKNIWIVMYMLYIFEVYYRSMKKKAIVLDSSIVRKNLDLPQWAIDEFVELAEINKNKFKPYVELTLINMARRFRNAKDKKANQK